MTRSPMVKLPAGASPKAAQSISIALGRPTAQSRSPQPNQRLGEAYSLRKNLAV
ncbi:hypothetical protein [Brasilonema sennae]|uniref:hypothetical protein n=1 Tax=Brasilonema sennae TaxID=1397703 RepID=UPI0015577EBF|nr:hypothetical protein [Brasilonema sennae]